LWKGCCQPLYELTVDAVLVGTFVWTTVFVNVP
jgi:hypothetical protein